MPYLARLKLLPVLIFLPQFFCACAGIRSTHLADLRAQKSPLSGRFKDLKAGERLEVYGQRRITWDGRYAWVAGDSMGGTRLKEYLEKSGAPDLAAKAAQAAPGNLQLFDKSGDAKSEGGNSGVLPSNVGNTPQEAAAIFAIGAALTSVVAAAIATQAIVEGIWTEVDPNPRLEDVLEAYNQRLAYALGLDFRDPGLITCMPRPGRPIELSGRSRAHGAYMIRAGIGAGIVAMGVSSAVAAIQASKNEPISSWELPTFGAGSTALLANLVLGYSVVW
jgi:hypothetical protein